MPWRKVGAWAIVGFALLAACTSRPTVAPKESLPSTRSSPATTPSASTTSRTVYQLRAGGTATVDAHGHVVVRDRAGHVLSDSDCASFDSYSKAVALLDQFQLAVARGDKDGVANLVRYPLRYNTAEGSRLVRSRQDLLRRYPELFPRAVRRQIAAPDPHGLFCNSQGFMIGDGVVWGDNTGGAIFRVVTLNVS